MKRLLLAGLLALPLAAYPPQAPAWCKFNFGVGANIGYQTGGSKSFLWGLYQSSDYNAVNPALVNGNYAAAQPPAGPAGFPAPAFNGYAPAPYGGYQAAPPAAAPEMGPMPSEKEPPRAKPAQFQPAPRGDVTTPVNYSFTNSGYGSYQAPSAQAPSYWYDK